MGRATGAFCARTKNCRPFLHEGLPLKLVLILLSRCNAACTHCAPNCGPHRTEALRSDEIVRLMNEAAEIEDGEPLEFHLTGGEPFINFELLTDVVAHGTRLGAKVCCVTNAYWARTPEIARGKLGALKEAGLTVLSVSVSRFHEKFVPIRRARCALEAAKELGIATELKGAVTLLDLEPQGALAGWKDTLDGDRINIFPVLPKLRAGAELPDVEYYREPGLPPHKCPGEVLCVNFDGLAKSCCAPGIDDGFVDIGNARDVPLREIDKNLRQGRRQRILRESGPIAFARGAIAAGLGAELRDAYAGPCDLCLHIRSTPSLRRIAEEMSSVTEVGAVTE
jgi:hypothetical protein